MRNTKSELHTTARHIKTSAREVRDATADTLGPGSPPETSAFSGTSAMLRGVSGRGNSLLGARLTACQANTWPTNHTQGGEWRGVLISGCDGQGLFPHEHGVGKYDRIRRRATGKKGVYLSTSSPRKSTIRAAPIGRVGWCVDPSVYFGPGTRGVSLPGKIYRCR